MTAGVAVSLYDSMSWKDIRLSDITDEELVDSSIMKPSGQKTRPPPPKWFFQKLLGPSNYEDVRQRYSKAIDEGKTDDKAMDELLSLGLVKFLVPMKPKDATVWTDWIKVSFRKLERDKRAGVKNPTRSLSYVSCAISDEDSEEFNELRRLRHPKRKHDTQATQPDICKSARTMDNTPLPITNLASFHHRLDEKVKGAKVLTDALRSIQHDPATLARFLQVDSPALHTMLQPFRNALSSGRVKPLLDHNLVRDDWPGIIPPRVFPVQEVNSAVALEDIFGSALQQLFFPDESAGDSPLLFKAPDRKSPIPATPSSLRALADSSSHESFVYAVNMPLPDIKVPPPREILEVVGVYSEEEYRSDANIATVGSGVNLHEDRGCAVVTCMDDRQIKLWMLYSYKRNKATFNATKDSPNQFAACEEQLRGHYVITFPGDAIYLPPGCIHTTHTILAGALFGSTFATAVGAADAASILRQDVLRHQVSLSSGSDAYIRSLAAAVSHNMLSCFLEGIDAACGLEQHAMEEEFTPGLARIVDVQMKGLLRENDWMEHQCPNGQCAVQGKLLAHFPFSRNLPGKDSSRLQGRRRKCQG